MATRHTLRTISASLSVAIIFFSLQANANGTASSYSFFVAGHIYGSPKGTEPVHPPFIEMFPYLQNIRGLEFGILTGDVVRNSTEGDWQVFSTVMEQLGFPYYLAPGNHDGSGGAVFKERFGKTYSSFVSHGDLFILLDGNIDGWSIRGKQLDFLRATLNKNAVDARNIFVFVHQIIWWDSGERLGKFVPNSFAGCDCEDLNFWTEVAPLFSRHPDKVYFFAGDVGAFVNDSEVVYHREDNLVLISSGMGGGKRDNFIVVNVDSQGSVKLELVALNGDNPDSLGSLETHNSAPLKLWLKLKLKAIWLELKSLLT